jgi:hypothetical protein
MGVDIKDEDTTVEQPIEVSTQRYRCKFYIETDI